MSEGCRCESERERDSDGGGDRERRGGGVYQLSKVKRGRIGTREIIRSCLGGNWDINK